MKNDSDNDGIVNPVTNDSSIVFGVLPKDVKRLGDGFKAKLYRCIRNSGAENGDNLHIMHVSTDLDAISDVMVEITNILQSRGFVVIPSDVSKDYTEVDVLIIGGDQQHIRDVINIATISSSIYGLFNRFDVLFYKLNGKTVIGLSPMEKLPLPDKLFRFECMFAIYYNIRKWMDPVVNRGIIADRVADIESILNSIVYWGVEKPSIDLFKMLNRFKINIKDNGRDDSNSEIFFAAMNTVRPVRNLALHGSHKEYNNDDDHFRVDTFNNMVSAMGRDNLCINVNSKDRKTMETMKDCIRLATYSLEWIEEYSERYCKK